MFNFRKDNFSDIRDSEIYSNKDLDNLKVLNRLLVLNLKGSQIQGVNIDGITKSLNKIINFLQKTEEK